MELDMLNRFEARKSPFQPPTSADCGFWSLRECQCLSCFYNTNLCGYEMVSRPRTATQVGIQLSSGYLGCRLYNGWALLPWTVISRQQRNSLHSFLLSEQDLIMITFNPNQENEQLNMIVESIKILNVTLTLGIVWWSSKSNSAIEQSCDDGGDVSLCMFGSDSTTVWSSHLGTSITTHCQRSSCLFT